MGEGRKKKGKKGRKENERKGKKGVGNKVKCAEDRNRLTLKVNSWWAWFKGWAETAVGWRDSGYLTSRSGLREHR